MISKGDIVEFRNWYRCEVLDIRDGYLVIQPFCNAWIVVRPSDVRLVKRADKKEWTTDKPADRPLTQEQIDLKNSPLGITLGL